MRESGLPPDLNKAELKKEASFKDLPLSEKEKWVDNTIREASKESSLETVERDAESFTTEQRKARVELKNALTEGNIQKIGVILDNYNYKINDQGEAQRLFNEFSIQEAAVNSAINAINRGETYFDKPEYYDFEKYLFIPYVIKDADFQEAVLKKVNEYLNKDNLFKVYTLVIQFLPKDTVSKENYAPRIRQSLIHILERERFSIDDFKIGLHCFAKLTPEPADILIEPDLQQAAKKTISRLSKLATDDKSVLLEILELKELFHIN